MKKFIISGELVMSEFCEDDDGFEYSICGHGRKLKGAAMSDGESDELSSI